MTLESTINKNRYIGNGATTQFPFTFKIWKADQILVYVGDGTTEQEVSAQCTVSLTASGGNVTFSTAPASGTVIVLRRNMPYIQEDDYRNGTRFDSEEVEDRFDQDCAERQDLRLDIGRAIKVPLTSNRTPENFAADFYAAHADTVSKHDAVVSMHAEVMAERPLALEAIAGARAEAVEAVGDEGEHQVQRIESAIASIYTEHGNGCMEMNWTLTDGIPADTDINISPLWYIVGRHHMQVSVNGVRQYRTKQFDEKGTEDSRSSVFTTLVDLNAGDTINVWIGHLAGGGTATEELDGLMSKEDKVKLDLLPAETSFARTTQVFSSAVSAGTAITVPEHAVGQGLLIVFHNGVLCDAGAQYTDKTDTTIEFSYDIPAGDTITAAAVAVRAS